MCRGADAVAAARLFGAGEAVGRVAGHDCSSSPRTTPTRSCAGNPASNTRRSLAAGDGGAWRRGETPVIDQGLIDALAATLRGADADPAFAAEALTLPSEAFLADQMAVADVDAIHAARDHARAAIGRALHADLQSDL